MALLPSVSDLVFATYGAADPRFSALLLSVVSAPERLRDYVAPLAVARVDLHQTVWFGPVKAVEVAGAELTVRPIHTLARRLVKHGGLALRFSQIHALAGRQGGRASGNHAGDLRHVPIGHAQARPGEQQP